MTRRSKQVVVVADSSKVDIGQSCVDLPGRRHRYPYGVSEEAIRAFERSGVWVLIA